MSILGDRRLICHDDHLMSPHSDLRYKVLLLSDGADVFGLANLQTTEYKTWVTLYNTPTSRKMNYLLLLALVFVHGR